MEKQENRKLVILGAAESGVGAAVLALQKGYDVFVSDRGAIKPAYKAALNRRGLRWEEGQHTRSEVLAADEVIKSPGIPDTAPMVVRVREAGIPIISEIEFAGRYTDARMICITGSNGKTTTTSLIYHILRNAGYDVGLAGNIGHSLALQVAEEPHAIYVIELSSFQLDNMYDFRANIAVLLNITPDHLDRYDYKMQNYTDSKMRILQNQTEDDAFIYWGDDPVVTKELHKYGIRSRQCPFSILRKEGMVGYVSDGHYVIEQPTPINMEQEALALRGKHNLYNSLAAGIAADLSGVDSDSLRRSLSDFQGIEHRLEFVCRDERGVTWINDSKATNVDACWYALESMTTPTVLIIGGLDKGNDYNAILPLVREKCCALVFLGADNSVLHAFFDGKVDMPIADVHSMADCVAECRRLVPDEGTVLLSPCCASFDLFNNMEDRGEQFKHLAKAPQPFNSPTKQ